MAKSKSFFGLRKGSTKSHTYSVLDGQQITKDRVYDVKNPRTEGQMRQRMLMTTVGAAYKFMKSIADHSFEGKSSGMPCMREFNSRNLNRFKNAASANGSVPFNEYKDSLVNPLPFLLAAGSLPVVPYSLNKESKLEVKITKDNPDFTTAEGIYSALGLQRGDLLTFCTVIGEGGVVGGIFDYTPDRFDIVRLTCDRSGAVSKPIDAFTVSTNNNEAAVEVSVDATTITITAGDTDFGAVIMSRQTNGTWLRSDAVMVVAQDLIAGAKTANQLSTYPIGTELILNNGPMANEGEGGASALPTPSLAFAQSSVSANGTATISAPKLSGIPSGASVSYVSQKPSVATVNASNGTITPVANGTATIVARTSATEEYAAGTASFEVVVSGIESSALAINPVATSFSDSYKTEKVTFANPNSEEVIVTINSGSGVSYSVASDKLSVTFSCNDTSSATDGNATIKVGSKVAAFSWDISHDTVIG